MIEIKEIIQKKKNIIKSLKKNENFLGMFRFFSFVVIVISFVLLYKSEPKEYLYLTFSLFSIIVFIILGIYLSKTQEKIKFDTNSVLICEKILLDFPDDNSSTDLNLQHIYCLDLDILGKKSLFNKLNYTQTYLGSDRLKSFLLNHLTDPEKIENRQIAIQELSAKLNWSIDFLTVTKTLNINRQLINKPISNIPPSSKVLISILLIFALFNICFIVSLFFFNITPFIKIVFFTTTIFLSILMSIIYNKRVKKILSSTAFKSKQYEQFLSVFSLIENEIFSSNLNNELKNNLLSDKTETSTKAIKRLSKLLRNYENGKAIPLLGAVLNIFTLWDLQFALRIGSQINKMENKLPSWVDTFAEFEALISFGIFAYKNPAYVYPGLSENPEELNITNIHHPLISSNHIISNDFSTINKNNIAIITGANMTGKSTFLRTIGVNLVLAMNGCPVAADQFLFYPMSLFTSMRTNDSLSDDTSYFNAEIKKLKTLVESLEKKIPQYIILDEILKGTNSHDKLMGSKLFLEKIMKLNTSFSCIIATHDLDLTKMEQVYSENIKNYCFELHENNQLLEPDYKLRLGVTKTMNALQLMRQYKIID